MTTASSDMLQRVANAILRPSAPGERRGMRQKCGVFDADGQRLPRADTLARLGRLSLDCDAPDPRDLPLRKGRWLFAGIGYHHFGHALIFSTARLWGMAQAENLDGVLFIDRGVGGETRPGTTRNMTKLLDAFGVELPVWTVSQPEQVEELIVPDQGISTDASLFDGTVPYRAYVRGVIDKIPSADPPAPQVYISRTKLGFHKAGLMFEDRIENHLQDQGYLIYHPQDHPIQSQIALYKSARRIIGVDGSALHLAAFAANPEAHVAVLARRAFYANAFCRQFTAFSGAQAVPIQAYDTVYAPQSSFQNGLLWFKTLCQTNLPQVQTQLIQHGFLEGGDTWTMPSPKRIARRLTRAAGREGEAFVPVPDALRRLEPGL